MPPETSQGVTDGQGSIVVRNCGPGPPEVSELRPRSDPVLCGFRQLPRQ